MSPEQAKMFMSFFISGFENEIAITKKVIGMCPTIRWSISPI